MDRRRFLTLAAIVLVTPLAVEGQPAGKVYRIGYIGISQPTPDVAYIVEALVQGLRDRGYVEGRNLVIERRYLEGRQERASAFVAEFVQAKVDVIVTPNTGAALAAKQATSTIPIVVVGVTDPDKSGLIASLARPGGNVTGIARPATEFEGKRLQVLKEAIPGLSRVAVLWNPDNRASAFAWEDIQPHAKALDIALVSVEIRGATDLEPGLERAIRERASALHVHDAMFPYRARITDFAVRNRIPTMGTSPPWAGLGALMGYGPSYQAMFRLAASYVDRIFQGASPAELPLEQPTDYGLVINRKTAKALGLTIPPSLLLRADQVIE